MKKPNFLKTRREKQQDRTVRLVAATLKFAVAVRDYRDRKEFEELQIESQKLENENIRLKNRLLELGVQN